MKVKTITIELESDSGTKIVCHRDSTYLWTFSGGVYPRIIGLVNYINDFCREFDKSAKENSKPPTPP